MTTSVLPSREVIARAISLAGRAPSVANSQPWLWRLTRGGLELSADRTRRLVVADPHSRSLLISCGVALHHLQVAMAAEGWLAQVERMPDVRAPGLLASVTFEPRTATDQMGALAVAISDRRSDRRPMSSWPVARDHVLGLIATAGRYGAFLHPLDNPMEAAEWSALSARVSMDHAADQGFRSELARIAAVSGAHADDPTTALMDQDLGWKDPSAVSRSGESRAEDDGSSSGTPLLLATSSDDRLAELRAGEALSAVLLEATRLGLASRVDNQPMESPPAREAIERDILQGSRSPQILVVVGWPHTSDEIAPAARRAPESTYEVADEVS